jgi:hypothetical protein
MPNYIEWGKDPEKGMSLFGFSCKAVLEGKKLKSEIIGLLKQGEVGIRKAIAHFKSESLACSDESINVVMRIKQDMKNNNIDYIYKKSYVYTINRVFWAHDKDVPKNDPRYCKLEIIDCNKINKDKYMKSNRQFDAKNFIKDFSNPEFLKTKKSKKNFFIKEEIPESNIPNEQIDQEWNNNQKEGSLNTKIERRRTKN